MAEIKKSGGKVTAINGPDECVQRSVAETIQEVIELTGFLCFLFRSTPTYNDDDGLEGQSSQRRVPPQLTIGLTLLEGCLAFISVMNDHHHDNYNHDNDNQDMQII